MTIFRVRPAVQYCVLTYDLFINKLVYVELSAPRVYIPKKKNLAACFIVAMIGTERTERHASRLHQN